MSSFSWTQTAPPPGRRFGKRRDGRGEKRRQCSIGAVKRLTLLALAVIVVRALLRRRRESTAPTWEPVPPAPAATPADDLKAKLAESRSVDEPEPAPPEAEPPAAEGPDVDVRRADVHARARQAMDELS